MIDAQEQEYKKRKKQNGECINTESYDNLFDERFHRGLRAARTSKWRRKYQYINNYY